MVNWIGDEMVQELVAGLTEPTTVNQITVSDEVAVFARVHQPVREKVVRARRCYRYRDRAGGVAPLDMKLGIDGCFGFSPLMTFLICMLGADESYGQAAEKLAATLGFNGEIVDECVILVDAERAARRQAPQSQRAGDAYEAPILVGLVVRALETRIGDGLVAAFSFTSPVA